MGLVAPAAPLIMPSLKKPLQQPNHYKVPAKQWKKWCDLSQRVFNETYCTMAHNKNLFMHPAQDEPRDEYWNTTAWNAAWTAAEAVKNGLDGIVEGKGYARKR